MKLKKCKDCGGEISKSAKMCPHCGAKIKSGCFSRLFKLLLIIVLVIAILGIIVKLLDQSEDDLNRTEIENVESPENKLAEEYIQENIVDDRKLIWLGKYLGREKCSEGKYKNQWSNPYLITIYKSDNEFLMKGIYFQSNELIKLNITGMKLIIPEQNIGETSFIIRGTGKMINGRILLDYEVDIIVGYDPKEIITNKCHAEFVRN